MVMSVVLYSGDSHEEGDNEQNKQEIIDIADNTQHALGKEVERHENVEDKDEKPAYDLNTSEEEYQKANRKEVFPYPLDYIG